MPDQCLTPEALKMCPTCLKSIATDSDQLDDSVHRFVRLMACYEVVIKLLGNAAHAVHIERSLNQSYCVDFENAFVQNRPSLGTWLGIVRQHSGYLARSGPAWLAVSMKWLREPGRKNSVLSRLSKYIGAVRQTLPSDGPIQAYSGLDCLGQVVYLRNAFSHGALTPRFAERYNDLLTAALEEYVLGLQIGSNWKFAVPLRYDPSDPTHAFVMNPEAPDSAPRSIPLGDRSTKPRWHSLYVGDSLDSFEDCVRLGPMMRYERTLRDYVFLNTYGDGEAEFLSYRSGDFDVRPASHDWREFFGLVLSVPAEVAPDATSVPAASVPTVAPPPTPAPAVSATPAPEVEPKALQAIAPDPKSQSTTPLVPAGPSIRDILAAFVELGRRAHAPDWGHTLDEWERMLTPFSDETLQQLFAEMKAHAQSAQGVDSLLLFLGNLQQRLGFHEDAAAQFKELVDKDPESNDRRSRYGCALLLWGNQLKAEGKTSRNNALIGKGKGVLGDAKVALIASLYKDPDTRAEVWHNIRALSMLVDACCRRGEFQEAAVYCDEGLKLEPENQRLNSQRLFIHETLSR
ncbi:MAG TPA: hypothetical protein PKE29_01400 [Phycisphaerales bacterium]|nr:hypothetical protein [Phycisphaerales bacterium]